VIWTICANILKSLRREKALTKKRKPEINFMLLKNNYRKEGKTFAGTYC